MATLTKSTGTVTLSGAAEKVTLPAVYGWVWIKNMSDSDIFAGLSADISEGADGVMTILAGECGRIQTDGSREFYLLGTGNALVVAQNYADCPFKSGAKGGEIPDLSEYAKTADVPNIKVNEAVNANTVGGKFANTFIQSDVTQKLEISINDLFVGTYSCEESYTPDFPKKSDGSIYGLFGLLDSRIYGSIQYQTMQFENGAIIHRERIINVTNWSDWKEISTTPIKSTTGTYAIDAWGGVTLWLVGQVGTPIFAYSKGYYAPITPHIGGNDMNLWRLIFSESSVFSTSREITIIYF